jgi:hypothetical protein
MARINLETYYKDFFKDAYYDQEQFKGINASHAISSEYYDVQFGRNSIIYRDKANRLTIPIEHDVTHTILIYLDYFIENNNCDADINLLRKRISTTLAFLKAKYQFE